MITKQQIADSMSSECDITKHLFTKLSPEAMAYQPAPGQRTTLELLRYLAICGIAGTKCMAEGNWKLFSTFADRVKEMKAEEFPAAMDLQKRELQEFFANVSNDALIKQEAPLPAGGTAPLGIAIMNGPFKWIAAYKLQLFLYAKATGATEIGTANAWAGRDMKPKG